MPNASEGLGGAVPRAWAFRGHGALDAGAVRIVAPRSNRSADRRRIGQEGKGRIPLEADLQLVAPITNPRSRRLEEVEVYLEHLGLSDAEFTPGTWSVGSLAAGDLFFATWPLRTSGQMTGTFDACVVVASKGKDPVRLHALIEISAKVRPERPRSSSR